MSPTSPVSRYLPFVITASIAFGFTACETTTPEKIKKEPYGYEGEKKKKPATDEPTPTPKPKMEKPVQEADIPPVNVEPTVTPLATPPLADYPTAAAVDGKPGFVKSPFGGSGIVDVRGYPPGTEVKDPYTGKVFLVP